MEAVDALQGLVDVLGHVERMFLEGIVLDQLGWLNVAEREETDGLGTDLEELAEEDDAKLLMVVRGYELIPAFSNQFALGRSQACGCRLDVGGVVHETDIVDI